MQMFGIDWMCHGEIFPVRAGPWCFAVVYEAGLLLLERM